MGAETWRCRIFVDRCRRKRSPSLSFVHNESSSSVRCHSPPYRPEHSVTLVKSRRRDNTNQCKLWVWSYCISTSKATQLLPNENRRTPRAERLRPRAPSTPCFSALPLLSLLSLGFQLSHHFLLPLNPLLNGFPIPPSRPLVIPRLPFHLPASHFVLPPRLLFRASRKLGRSVRRRS